MTAKQILILITERNGGCFTIEELKLQDDSTTFKYGTMEWMNEEILNGMRLAFLFLK
jgi:hypothetical protein